LARSKTANKLPPLIKYGAYSTSIIVFFSAYFAPHFILNDRINTAQDKSFSVGIVQGNIEQSMRWVPELDQPIMDKYRTLTDTLWQYDVVIWPEAAVPKLESEAQSFLHQIDAQAYATDTGLITGIVNYDFGRDLILNQLITLGRKNATLDQPQYYYGHNNRFAKHHLLPIGEFIPLENWLRGLAPIFDLPMSSFTRGAYVQENLQANGLWFVPAICFEIVFPRQIRANITPQSNAIVTVSNDAWFGDSHGPHQHMQIAQMRALEFGLPVIRVTNNGITGVIDHHGQIQSRLPQFTEGVLVDTVTTPTSSTLYRQYGDTIPFGVALLWMLLILGLYFLQLQLQSNKRLS
jgi:apolipoprotein N-acyltransferase